MVSGAGECWTVSGGCTKGSVRCHEGSKCWNAQFSVHPIGRLQPGQQNWPQEGKASAPRGPEAWCTPSAIPLLSFRHPEASIQRSQSFIPHTKYPEALFYKNEKLQEKNCQIVALELSNKMVAISTDTEDKCCWTRTSRLHAGSASWGLPIGRNEASLVFPKVTECWLSHLNYHC
jgi:hypothetical protein